MSINVFHPTSDHNNSLIFYVPVYIQRQMNNLICNVVHFPHTKTKVSTRLYEIYDGIRSPYSSNFLKFLLARLLSHSCSYEDRDETHEYVACRQILG